MNPAVARGNKGAADGLVNAERLFERTTDVVKPSPAQLWVFVDEHPDSINDGAFFNAQGSREWIDLPANYHNNAGGFAFADGHSEIHRWRGSVTRRPVQINDFARTVFPVGDPDFAWIIERTSAPRQ
ncbi:MAG TPA: hypothetical protein PKE47_11620, partial [Verrucomicrobiota bacterium]|nr:hypothetical protein [Verrucomicrobiota bacterium]